MAVCFFLGSLGVSAAAAHSKEKLSVATMMISALSFQGATAPLIWWFVRQHGLSLREAFGFNLTPRHAILLGVTVALGFMPLAIGLQWGVGMIADAIGFPLPTQDAVMILRLADSWVDRLGLAFATMVLAPLGEESLFRGVLYPTLKRYGFPQAALWITSLLFAFIHFNALSFVPLLVLAVLLVKLYERTGNLLSCIACHATFNAFSFVMLLLESCFKAALEQSP